LGYDTASVGDQATQWCSSFYIF